MIVKKFTAEEIKGKKDLLFYLMGIADETQGAKVWKQLFCEIYHNLIKQEKLNDSPSNRTG